MKKSDIKKSLTSIFIAIVLTIFYEAISIGIIWGDGFLAEIETPIFTSIIIAKALISIAAVIFILRGLLILRKQCLHFNYAIVLYVIAFVLQTCLNFVQIFGANLEMYLMAFYVGIILEAFSFVIISCGIADLFKSKNNAEKYINKNLRSATVLALCYSVGCAIQILIVTYLNDLYTDQEAIAALLVSFVLVVFALVWFAVVIKKSAKELEEK